VSIKIRVRPTSETVVGNVEVQDQRHRVHLIRKVGSQIDVPTIMTPAFRHQLCSHFVCCVEKVSELINHQVVSLLDTRVGGTSTEMITKII